MAIKLKNNVSSTLASAINASDVGLVVAAGTGAQFPALGANDYFYATLVSPGGTQEVVRVTARVGDTMTVLRAQEGSAAQSFAAGARIEMRITAQSVFDAVSSTLNYQGASDTNPTVRLDGTALQPGDFYFNTVSNELRFYNGAGWQTITTGSVTVERFIGTGSTTTFTLAEAPLLEEATQIYVNGVYQQKNTYSVSGASLVFTAAPPAGASIEVVTLISIAIGSTSSEKVSYQAAGVGAVARTVQAKLREVVSVQDFGAVGDGSTDDTVAIQAAINTGHTVYFPQTIGGYLITAPLVVSTFNQVLYGDRGAVTNRPTIRLSASSSALNVFSVTGASITFRGLTIVGRGRTITGMQGVIAERPTGVADIDLYIIDCTIGSCNTAVRIVGRGFTTQQTNYVDNLLCFKFDWPSPFVPGTNPDQTALSGMRVYVVQDCRFHAMSSYYIAENNGANAANIHGFQFTGNYIDTLASIFNGELHDSVISGNVLIHSNSTAFPVINLSAGSDSIISNNLFYGMDDNGTGLTYELLAGVSLGNASRIQITNNQFNRVRSDVIRIGAGCSNILINGNIMKNVCLENATVSTGRAPVRISAAVSGLSICNNIIETPNMTYNISIAYTPAASAVTNHHISGNIFDTAGWKLTNFADSSTNTRLETDNKLVRYDGNGAATQTITFTFKPYVAILCNMTAGINDMVMITSRSTAGSSYGDIDGYDVIVTGDFNINLAQYSIYAFA